MEIIVDPNGTARCLYAEDIDLAALGEVGVIRASHCEPDEHGWWWADLSPVAGPKLGPFPKRSAALEAEIDWLRAHVLRVAELKPEEDS